MIDDEDINAAKVFEIVVCALEPDGNPCESDTRGLLKRAHVIAGEM